MEQEPIKNQWRVLFPEKPLSASACREAHECGFHASVVEKESDSFPLKPILKMTSSSVSPFSEDFLKDVPTGRSLFWESPLFTADLKKDLIERALLPFELHLIEMEKLVEIAGKQVIYYRLPDAFSRQFQERHLEQFLRRSDRSIYFVHSAVAGNPQRMDLPPHPLLAKKHSRLLPLYHAQPLEGEWRLPLPTEERYCLIVPEGWKPQQERGSLEDLDTRLCYLQAIIQGEENPPPEEIRLLADLLIAEMRYQHKRGDFPNQERKRKLLIRALEKLRVPVPLSLTMD
jgi:hypothetical protein